MKNKAGWPWATILTLIFVTLKLGGWGVVATWSWIWVFSPIWICLALIAVAAAILGVIIALSSK